MAGFDDLIAAAMPYLATEYITGSAGSDWEWDYEFEDDDGNLVTINSGFTFTAKLHSRSGGTYTVVYTATTSTPTATVLRCTMAAATTTADPGAMYYHEVRITRTSDGKKILAVGAGDSKFIVKAKES